jgi:hypothetical protein
MSIRGMRGGRENRGDISASDCYYKPMQDPPRTHRTRKDAQIRECPCDGRGAIDDSVLAEENQLAGRRGLADNVRHGKLLQGRPADGRVTLRNAHALENDTVEAGLRNRSTLVDLVPCLHLTDTAHALTTRTSSGPAPPRHTPIHIHKDKSSQPAPFPIPSRPHRQSLAFFPHRQSLAFFPLPLLGDDDDDDDSYSPAPPLLLRPTRAARPDEGDMDAPVPAMAGS